MGIDASASQWSRNSEECLTSVQSQGAATAVKKRQWPLKRLLLAIDAIAVTSAWLVLIGLGWLDGAGHVPGVLLLAGVACIACLGLMQREQLYRSRVCSVRMVETQRIGRALLYTGIGLYALDRAIDAVYISGEEILLACLVSFLALFAGRTGYRSWLRARRRDGLYPRRILLIGANEDAKDVIDTIREHPELGYRVCGIVGPRSVVAHSDVPWLGDLERAVQAAQEARATGVLLIVTGILPAQVRQLTRDLLDARLHVYLQNGLISFSTSRLRVTPIAYQPLVYVEQPSLARWQVLAKRCMDVFIAAAVLVVTTPILAVSAVLIKLHDRGPVIFRQQRVGRDGAIFTLYKLRTMSIDAEDRAPTLRMLNQRSEGPLFKMARDPRVTPIGRLLRATSIDELPQLVNVLAGQMSLVGPRPALPTEFAQFDEVLRTRAKALPGITGLWQVEARDNPAFGPYRRLDLYYVENWTLGLDFLIMVATAGAVLVRATRAVLEFLVPGSKRYANIGLIE